MNKILRFGITGYYQAKPLRPITFPKHNFAPVRTYLVPAPSREDIRGSLRFGWCWKVIGGHRRLKPLNFNIRRRL
jgi:hypothetical protein